MEFVGHRIPPADAIEGYPVGGVFSVIYFTNAQRLRPARAPSIRLDSRVKSCQKSAGPNVGDVRGAMGKLPANAFVVCALLLLAACATASLESQTKMQDPRQARIYFLRESTLLYVAATPNIKVNGEEVGRVANGSYFFVDRPAGKYNITLEMPLTPGRFAADVTVRPGAVYYVKVSPRAEHWFIGAAAGLVGHVLEAAVSENSGPYSLTALDEKAGAEMLRQLKG
jgi:Protein of unknown function (DUF2846)